MSDDGHIPSIVMVLTARGPERILAEGGSQAWHLNPVNAAKHDYLVCVQNRNNGTWGGATEPHGTAFLIGKISTVEESDEPPEPGRPKRYIIRISEYARIAVPVVWPGRNPVKYATLAVLGMHPSQIKWQPMPPRMDAADDVEEDSSEPYAPEVPSVNDQTGVIPAFKAQIAAALGVMPSQVRVTIEA